MPDPKRLRGSDPLQPLNWRTVESLGHAHFHQRGWRILISPYDTTTGYDFVAECDGSFCRVNVKQASPRKDRKRGYQIAKPGRTRQPRDPDCYLVWLPREQQFIELPGDFLKGRSSRAIPVRYFHHLEEKPQ